MFHNCHLKLQTVALRGESEGWPQPKWDCNQAQRDTSSRGRWIIAELDRILCYFTISSSFILANSWPLTATYFHVGGESPHCSLMPFFFDRRRTVNSVRGVSFSSGNDIIITQRKHWCIHSFYLKKKTQKKNENILRLLIIFVTHQHIFGATRGTCCFPNYRCVTSVWPVELWFNSDNHEFERAYTSNIKMSHSVARVALEIDI